MVCFVCKLNIALQVGDLYLNSSVCKDLEFIILGIANLKFFGYKILPVHKGITVKTFCFHLLVFLSIIILVLRV